MKREDERAKGYAEAVADLLAWIEKEERFTTEPEPWSTLRAIHACVREGKHMGCAKHAPRCARVPRRCEGLNGTATPRCLRYHLFRSCEDFL